MLIGQSFNLYQLCIFFDISTTTSSKTLSSRQAHNFYPIFLSIIMSWLYCWNNFIWHLPKEDNGNWTLNFNQYLVSSEGLTKCLATLRLSTLCKSVYGWLLCLARLKRMRVDTKLTVRLIFHTKHKVYLYVSSSFTSLSCHISFIFEKNWHP